MIIHSVYIALLFIAIVSNSVLCAILMARGHRAIAVTAFILLLVFINIWAIPRFLIDAFFIQGTTYEHLNRMLSLGYIFLPVAFLVFSLSFITRNFVLTRFFFWVFLLVPPFIFLYLSWTTNLIDIHDVSKALVTDWGVFSPPGPLFPLFLFWFACVMGFALILLIHLFRTANDKVRKKQTQIVIIAIVLPLVIGVITDGILPILGMYAVPAALPLTAFTSSVIVYAILRYGLFEVTPFSILSSIEEGIVTIDNKGSILQMNAYAEGMLGIQYAKDYEMSIRDELVLIDKKERKVHMDTRFLSTVLQKGRKFVSDAYLLKSRRKLTPISLSVSPVYSRSSIIGATFTFRSIIKEQQREQQKNDFISIVSHELKTPITSIHAYNQLLLRQVEQKGADRARRIVLKVDGELSRLSRLINNFLDVSRVQAGRLSLEKEVFKLQDVVTEVANEMRTVYKNRPVQIQGKTQALVLADRSRIEQVLINLLSNALKYSPKQKEVAVSLAMKRDRVQVGVRDYGPGVPTELQKKIFERVHQLPGNSFDETHGLGLGLYVSANIIKQHGGKMWLVSKRGRGSTFYFSLPFV